MPQAAAVCVGGNTCSWGCFEDVEADFFACPQGTVKKPNPNQGSLHEYCCYEGANIQECGCAVWDPPQTLPEDVAKDVTAKEASASDLLRRLSEESLMVICTDLQGSDGYELRNKTKHQLRAIIKAFLARHSTEERGKDLLHRIRNAAAK